VQNGEPSDVAARTRHAGDESAADRIGNHHEYDGNCAGRLHQRRHNGRAVAKDAVGLELHQFLRKSLHARRVVFGIAVLDAKVLADGPALHFETLLESHQAASGFRIIGKPHQHPHGAHASCRLRISRDRLGGQRAAEQRDKFPPPHGPYPRLRITN